MACAQRIHLPGSCRWPGFLPDFPEKREDTTEQACSGRETVFPLWEARSPQKPCHTGLCHGKPSKLRDRLWRLMRLGTDFCSSIYKPWYLIHEPANLNFLISECRLVVAPYIRQGKQYCHPAPTNKSHRLMVRKTHCCFIHSWIKGVRSAALLGTSLGIVIPPMVYPSIIWGPGLYMFCFECDGGRL